MIKIEGSASRSISQRHGSADPDPNQNIMNPQRCYQGCSITTCRPAPAPMPAGSPAPSCFHSGASLFRDFTVVAPAPRVASTTLGTSYASIQQMLMPLSSHPAALSLGSLRPTPRQQMNFTQLPGIFAAITIQASLSLYILLSWQADAVIGSPSSFPLGIPCCGRAASPESLGLTCPGRKPWIAWGSPRKRRANSGLTRRRGRPVAACGPPASSPAPGAVVGESA
jgi:hypothetical protein